MTAPRSGTGPSSAGGPAEPPPPARPKFAAAARAALADTRRRRNLRGATAALRDREAAATRAAADWEELREAGRAIRDDTLLNLDTHLEELERAVTEAGGVVHWAADAGEARGIVTGLVRAAGATEVVKASSATLREIGLDEALEAIGVTSCETALADLVVRLGGDEPSHPLSPAVHRDRAQIGELFRRELPAAGPDLADDPAALAGAARDHLRGRLLRARVAVTGANFLVAETGTAVVLESEGNARM